MPNAEPTQRLATAAKTIEKETHANMSEAHSTTETVATEDAPAAGTANNGVPGEQFVGQWNQLVSTTNWEKGQIIFEWREALIESDAPAAEYSDEAWTQLVGGVTSQHVGRLRRVYQRFEKTFTQYPQLFWSHFQAALDWDDAEMWLEGAIQQKWSVSQMRGKRWETVGKPGEPLPEEPAAEIDNGAAEEQTKDSDQFENSELTGSETSLNSVDASDAESAERGESDDDNTDKPERDDAEVESMSAVPKQTRERLGVEVGELPDDLADAFEAFKLAIISQRRVEWSETSVETVLECLDALKQLAEAPLD